MTYEANHKIAARIGVTAKTFADWLTGDRQPMGKSLEKLRGFLDAEAKRNAGDGIRPIERVPFKIVKPAQQVRYARLCPFCRKARVKIQSNSRKQFQGVCPKCGASGPKRKSQREALRAWNTKNVILQMERDGYCKRSRSVSVTPRGLRCRRSTPISSSKSCACDRLFLNGHGH